MNDIATLKKRGGKGMNTLREHVLREVSQLDMKNLVALQSIVVALKKPRSSRELQKRGEAAAHCRELLCNIQLNLSQAIIEEREDRL